MVLPHQQRAYGGGSSSNDGSSGSLQFSRDPAAAARREGLGEAAAQKARTAFKAGASYSEALSIARGTTPTQTAAPVAPPSTLIRANVPPVIEEITATVSERPRLVTDKSGRPIVYTSEGRTYYKTVAGGRTEVLYKRPEPPIPPTPTRIPMPFLRGGGLGEARIPSEERVITTQEVDRGAMIPPLPPSVIRAAPSELTRATRAAEFKEKYVEPVTSGLFWRPIPQYTPYPTKATPLLYTMGLVGSVATPLKAAKTIKGVSIAEKAARFTAFEKLAPILPKTSKFFTQTWLGTKVAGVPKQLIGGFGGFYGTEALLTARRPELERELRKTQEFEQALKRGQEEWRKEVWGYDILKEGAEPERVKGKVWYKKLAYEVPVLSLATGGEEAFMKGFKEYFKEKGIKPTPAMITTAKAKRRELEYAQAAGYIGIETGSELAGSKSVAGAFARLGKQRVIPVKQAGGKLFLTGAKELAPIGVTEAGIQEVIQQKARRRDLSPKEIAIMAGIGGVSAGLGGGAVLGLWRKPAARGIVSTSLRIADPYETFGDIGAAGIRTVEKKIFKMDIPTPAIITKAAPSDVVGFGTKGAAKRAAKAAPKRVPIITFGTVPSKSPVEVFKQTTGIVETKKVKARGKVPSFAPVIAKAPTTLPAIVPTAITPISNIFTVAPTISPRTPVKTPTDIPVITPTETPVKTPTETPVEKPSNIFTDTFNSAFAFTQTYTTVPTMTPTAKIPPPLPLMLPLGAGGAAGSRKGRGRKYVDELQEGMRLLDTLTAPAAASMKKLDKMFRPSPRKRKTRGKKRR